MGSTDERGNLGQRWRERIEGSRAAALAMAPLAGPPVDVRGRAMADWSWRVLATTTDVVLLSALAWVLVAVAHPGAYVVEGLDLLLVVAYLTLCIGVWGKTVGNVAAKTAVVDTETGDGIGLARAGIRAVCIVAFIFTMVLIALDVFWPLGDPRRQTLHDKAATSIVVRTGSWSRRG